MFLDLKVRFPLLDIFEVSNHSFINFESKTCSKVVREVWKMRLGSGMHSSRGLPKELSLGLLKSACVYMATFGYLGYTISNTNPYVPTVWCQRREP